MDAHQVETFEVTVDVHCEDIKEGEDELEETVKDESVKENVLGCVEVVNGQEDKLEQIGEAECMEETVLEQVEIVNEEKEIKQIEENECVEGFQGEDSSMEAGTQSHQGVYNQRIRRIGICVLSCAVGILLWGVYRCGVYEWGVDSSDCTIPVQNWLPPWH
jgi:ASC-1-like (ASCH) protein